MNAQPNAFEVQVTSASTSTADDAPSSSLPTLDSRLLLNGGREVLIRHGDECYRLRHTRNDKLILTK